MHAVMQDRMYAASNAVAGAFRTGRSNGASNTAGSITCSDCGTAMPFDDLPAHQCQRDSYFTPVHDNKKKPDMRIDLDAIPRHHDYLAPHPSRGQQWGDRSPASSVGQGSMPPSPGEELSRSFSSASSASSGARSLPFLEKYKAMGSPNLPISRSATLSPSREDRLTPFGGSGSLTTLPSPRDARFASRTAPISTSKSDSSPVSSRAPSGRTDPASDWSSASHRYNSRNTPPSSVSSPVAPVTQKSHRETNREDHRATIRPSPSTPAGFLNGARRQADPNSGLDACLEDLRLYAEGDVQPDDEGDDFDYLRDFIGGGSSASEVLTPRAAPRAPTSAATLPHSHSTPALASSAALARKIAEPTHCTRCRADLSRCESRKAGDGQPFCKKCYSYLYLPKCRKCALPIEGGSVSSSDGKISGKFHPDCFVCFECSAPFTMKEFYVFDSRPYCQLHYHSLNGSLCTNGECGRPIEGPCVSLVGEENGSGGRYHPSCFKCSHGYCRVPLMEHHWVVDSKPYCERHAIHLDNVAREQHRSRPRRDLLAQKRQTIITRR